MFLFLGLRELNHDGSDIPVEALATPKTNANAEAGAPPTPNTATSNLATDAKERFDSVFSTTQQEQQFPHSFQHCECRDSKTPRNAILVCARQLQLVKPTNSKQEI